MPVTPQRTVVAALPFVLWASFSLAQDAAGAVDLQREVETARAEATAAAGALHDELMALIPSVPGWTCRDQERREGVIGTTLDPIPFVALICEHPEQSLDVTLMLDLTSATLQCRSITSKQRGIANGRIVPDLFRFFEGGAWRVMRSAVDLDGCAAGLVALRAQGSLSEEAIARGPAAIDAFAEAVLGSDPGPLLTAAEASGQAAALDRLMSFLNAQSRLMAELIPSPPGATRDVTLPSMEELPEDLRLPVPTILAGSPSAAADLEADGCRVHIELSASPVALYEATETSRWGRPGGEDGSGEYAHIRRNTDRFVGQERKDGTGIEVLVDGAVIVRVVIPGNEPCENDPEIVPRLFEEILEHDLSAFRSF